MKVAVGAIPVLAVPAGQVSPALPLLSQERLLSHGTCPVWGGPDEGGQHLHGGGGVGLCSQPLLHLLLETLGHLQEGLIGEPHVVQVLVDLKGGDKAQRSGGGLGTWAQAPRQAQGSVQPLPRLLGVTRGAGAGSDPSQGAGHGSTSTGTALLEQLIPGITHHCPAPLSKELTKCHPTSPSQAAATLGMPNHKLLLMLHSIFSHLQTPKQVATEAGIQTQE